MSLGPLDTQEKVWCASLRISPVCLILSYFIYKMEPLVYLNYKGFLPTKKFYNCN